MATDPILVAEDAMSLTVESPQIAQAVAARLRGVEQSRPWEEVVPGLTTVTVRFDPMTTSQGEVSQALLKAAALSVKERDEPRAVITIPVRYGGDDGPDFGDVCHQLSMSAEALIARHTAATHRVDMMGFTPGFAYLSADDAPWAVPRLGVPRPRVPAGSVGVSAGYTGLFALPGPGGWPLIGRTDLSLFAPSAEEPFRLQPGQQVRFEAV